MKIYEIQNIFPDLSIDNIDDTIKSLETFRFDNPIYIIAMTPRTGSTALASILKKTNAMGSPAEYLNPRGIIQNLLKNRNDIKTFKDYLSFLNKEKSENWFGLKIGWWDFEFFYETGLFKTLFKDAKYIYLDRFDLEAQAVSLQHAIVTKQWHFSKETEESYDVTEDAMINQFDLIKLCRLVENLRIEKENWQTFLYSYGGTPLYLFYELFLKDKNNALKKVINFLNVKGQITGDTSKIISDYKKVIKPGYDNWLYKLRMYRSGHFYLSQKTNQK